MAFWKKRTEQDIHERITKALNENISYFDSPILGMPGSYLDEKIFSKNNPILNNAPFLQTLVNNPNHIGCHTLVESESTFTGTHKIEVELLNIIACDIFKSQVGSFDGYVASGGTEANMQALWIYREFFKREKNASLENIAVICSSDTHYSFPKACNLLNLDLVKIQVDTEKRAIPPNELENQLNNLKKQGKTCVIFVANMMTTMFGSVDDLAVIATALKKSSLNFKVHVDGAYGGFFYPFSNEQSNFNFQNPIVDSITVDAHKMLQAPYGTGIFLVRKGFMQYTHSKDASYVKGEDYTIVGSRSGANAIAVWMILSSHGKHGWSEKTHILKKRTDWLCAALDKLNIAYFRNPYANIVTMKAKHISPEIAQKYLLVPDNHHYPNWYKIVVMDHVGIDQLEPFIEELAV